MHIYYLCQANKLYFIINFSGHLLLKSGFRSPVKLPRRLGYSASGHARACPVSNSKKPRANGKADVSCALGKYVVFYR